ncbi:MAG: hypothetical protein Q8K89_05315 [Actinomycetota bacterium]|nr:hypothetical protein [Actinomycetota bacterium]
MKVNESTARKYWRLATEDQIAAELRKDGYDVSTDEDVGGHRADLVARRGDQLLVYEFKTADWTPSRMEQAIKLRNYVVHNMDGDFKLVWVAPPVERRIEIDDFEETLFEHLTDNTPASLDALSSHTAVDELVDIEIRSVHLRKDRTVVTGDAVVEVSLVYGSGRDEEGDHWADAYPLNFEVTLDQNLQLHPDEDTRIEIDTSEFYE